MISKDEIRQKSIEFGIAHSNVERDYVFGWLLVGIYSISDLRNTLILKGGNCFRKTYFENTRFSKDLDFSTEYALDESSVKNELNKVCLFVQESTGVIFDLDRNMIKEKMGIDSKKKVYEARLYFHDFQGNTDHITISVRLDITEFDKVYLPVQSRNLIHPYSDSDKCKSEIKCIKLEELLATKLKCLLQRRHSSDLYDYVYSIFINQEIAVDRSEIVSTFLKKTIYERSPGVVKNLLTELPFDVFRAIWDRYLVCPTKSMIHVDEAIDKFKNNIIELFGHLPVGRGERIFFPANYRNMILDAGSNMTLLEITYDGYTRAVEPYSLIYKKTQDGIGREYLYVYDRTGGKHGPGIKCFVCEKILSMKSTTEKFEPQHEVELSKAGEYGDKTYFSSPFGGTRSRSGFRSTKSVYSSVFHAPKWCYVVQCGYCNKTFKRSTRSTVLNEHKDKYGNRCYGRHGMVIDQRYE